MPKMYQEELHKDYPSSASNLINQIGTLRRMKEEEVAEECEDKERRAPPSI